MEKEMKKDKKLLFFHSGEKLKEDTKGNLYTDGSYNEKVWERYLTISKNMSVIFRKDKQIYEQEEALNKFNYFDKQKIKFIELKNSVESLESFISIKQRKYNRNIIKKAVMEADLIIIRLPSDASNIVVKYAKKFKKPYLVEVVGCPWDTWWNHSVKGKILAPWMYLSTKYATKDALYALYVTNNFLQKRYPSRGQMIGCSDVSLTKGDNEILEKRIRNISKHKEKIIIGTLGSLDVKYKGQQYVIEAISRLKKEGYNFEYQIVGGGNSEYLKSIAIKFGVQEDIKLLGCLPHNQVFGWLDSVDVYVQPSVTEGLPRSVIEAMSRGCFVMGTRVGGMPELISSSYLFKAKNVDSICKILSQINKEIFLEQAMKNVNISKLYEVETLNKKRNRFYKQFGQNTKF